MQATEVAQPAIGAASVGLLRLLAKVGVQPDMTAGHSYGELVALHAAGALDTRGLAWLSQCRGRLLRDAGGDRPGAMAALLTGPESVPDLIGEQTGVLIVNFNGPRQTVVAGPREAIDAVLERALARQVHGRLLPVACAFHTPLMEPARGPLARHALEALTGAPSCPVFSNLDASIHPPDPGAIAGRLGDHVTSPVRFAEMIMAMHDQGARLFVEVGPSGLLTTLIGSILGNRPHLAVACDTRGRPSLVGFLHALARLAVAGLPVRLGPLTRGRAERLLDLETLPEGDGSPPPGPSTWMVNGSRAASAGRPRTPAAGPGRGAAGPRVIAHTVPPGSAGQSRHAKISNTRPYEQWKDASRSGLDAGHAGYEPGSLPRSFLRSSRTRPGGIPGDDAKVSGSPAHDDADLFLRQAATARGPSGTPCRCTAPPGAVGPTEPSAPVAASAAADTPRPPSHGVAGAVSPAATSKPPAPVPAGREEIARMLLGIVRERTGYPPEVLRLELDLEAELGIDSIKRVEILGKLRDAFPQLGDASDPEAMDRLVSARTLAAIVDRVERAIGSAGAAAAPNPNPPAPCHSSRRRPAGRGTARSTVARTGCSWRR